MVSLIEPEFDFNLVDDIQLVDESELPPVAGHVAVEYRNTMIVWGGYVSRFFGYVTDTPPTTLNPPLTHISCVFCNYLY